MASEQSDVIVIFPLLHSRGCITRTPNLFGDCISRTTISFCDSVCNISFCDSGCILRYNTDCDLRCDSVVYNRIQSNTKKSLSIRNEIFLIFVKLVLFRLSPDNKKGYC